MIISKFTSEHTAFISRKVNVFQPVEFANDITYLKDQISAAEAESENTCTLVNSTVSKLQTSMGEAKKKLDAAYG